MDSPQTKFLAELDTMRSGVYITTSAHEGKPAGCTCVWVTRASFEPPLIAVNISPVRHTFQTIEKSRRFCVNIMGESGLEQARFFGFHSGHLEEKFRNVKYTEAPSGSPLLGLAVAYLDCALHEVIPIGDHRLVIGEITAAAIVSEESPMIYDPTQFYQEQADRAEAAQ